jgi:replication-associated recombination protein RarA
LGHTGYRYAHDAPGHFVDQEYIPTDKIYYQPIAAGYEETIRRRMEHWESLRRRPRGEQGPSPEKEKEEA